MTRTGDWDARQHDAPGKDSVPNSVLDRTAPESVAHDEGRGILSGADELLEDASEGAASNLGRFSHMNPPRTPWSEWMTVPVTSIRLLIAKLRALVTSAAVGEASMDQPTTRRE